MAFLNILADEWLASGGKHGFASGRPMRALFCEASPRKALPPGLDGCKQIAHNLIMGNHRAALTVHCVRGLICALQSLTELTRHVFECSTDPCQLRSTRGMNVFYD